MIWIFAIFLLVSVGLLKLGAMSVMVVVLSSALKLVLLLILLGAAFMAWQAFRRR